MQPQCLQFVVVCVICRSNVAASTVVCHNVNKHQSEISAILPILRRRGDVKIFIRDFAGCDSQVITPYSLQAFVIFP